MTHCPGNPNFENRRDAIIGWSAIVALLALYAVYAVWLVS